MEPVQPQPKAKKRFEVKVPEPYKFIRTLGQGRFGSVHEVSKTPSDEHFAMKILPFTSESDFEKNEHEISKLSKNQHRNVVGFVEVIEGDNAHFVVLELCSHSLHDELCENSKLGGKMDVVNPSQRISSAELVRTNRLQSVLGPETPLSRFVTQELDTTRQQFQNAFQATKQKYEARINEQNAQIGEQVSLLEATRQQLKKEQRERAKEQQEHAKEHEALIREQTEHKKTQQLLHKQEQAHQADKTKIQTLERKLSAAQEENRRLKRAAHTQRDVPRSVTLTVPAVSSFIFTCPSHFRVNNNEITRTGVGTNPYGGSAWSSVLLPNIFTNGVISVEITILSLDYDTGNIHFGLMDSSSPIPALGALLGSRVRNSVSLNNDGYLNFSTTSSTLCSCYRSELAEGDCVRMEVDLDSTPRTLQFFVNGDAGWCYVSGIPSSVRIGTSVKGDGTSFRIDNISRLSHPTPILEEMMEVKW
ncbi:hypothetical protein BLNAU_19037 [Blattamonas nauphoetae]|uniref:Protein kinase domain-containing protein n=1 Tax=Blattamonas nauphoetae TaxID=2049346 RepID=A0ABQ9X2N2_9EUKA|nr:hypothetical protein BLNAU_19037 [Blattamonas nauphoetae]